jgi:molybdate/tungstate transport system ATP-binding protein
MIDARIRKTLGQFSLDCELAGDGSICIAGRNGSGKTTTMKTIAGLIEFDEGYVRVDGRDVSSLPAESRGIVMVTPTSPIPHLAVDSHILWGARLGRRPPSKERLDDVKSRLGINFDGRVGHLSMGMKERVCLATALLSSARVILVDEAFSNLHEKEAFIKSYLNLAKETKVDVIFSSLDQSEGSLADHLFVIEDGRTKHIA